MHKVSNVQANHIDGTVYCDCGWYRYTTYPKAGWGRKSVGYLRPDGMSKKDVVKDKLSTAFIAHLVKVAS